MCIHCSTSENVGRVIQLLEHLIKSQGGVVPAPLPSDPYELAKLLYNDD